MKKSKSSCSKWCTKDQALCGGLPTLSNTGFSGVTTCKDYYSGTWKAIRQYSAYSIKNIEGDPHL